MFQQLKDYYNRVKTAHVKIQSLQFVKFVITTSFVPIFMYLIGLNVSILLALLTELRQFVAVIFSTQTVAGVLAYGVALIDSDGNGESDELDAKAHTKQPMGAGDIK